jgi:FlaA1/EpsC-like NDP-sugar epimerase
MSVAERVGGRVAALRADLPLAILDVVVVSASYTAVFALLRDRQGDVEPVGHLGWFVLVAVAVHLVVSWRWRLYGQLWRYASVAEATRVVTAGLTSAVLLVGGNAILHAVPQAIAVLGCLLANALSGGVRFQARILSMHRRREGRFGQRVLLVGAGEGGNALVREMLTEPDPEFVPVAIVDDNPRLHGLQLAGVPIEGGIVDLPAVAARHRADLVLLAVPSADSQMVERVVAGAEAASLPVKLVPRVRDLLGANPSVRDVRDLRVEDLLGRDEVVTDLDGVRRLLSGRVVLITGGGGSIGSEIARQVAAFEPDRLVLLDQDETHLHDTAASLPIPADLVLADIRDADVIREVFNETLPDVVFHAAALKHVPILEDFPCEAVRTNVVGTRNVADAAMRAGVRRLVFISTDKAVMPTSVMGASKFLAEQLVTAMAPSGARWSSVRFGNVLGSRGSVLPTFARQIEAGGPVTVTDARMTRFFMSVGEAVQLVLQAAVFAEGRDLFMLDMGEPVSILDLAERMIRLSGRAVGDDVPIRIVGARPGEKLVEQLRAQYESQEPTPHPSVNRLWPVLMPTAALDRSLIRLQAIANANDHAGAAQFLLSLASSVALDEIDLTESEAADRTVDDGSLGTR